MPKHPSEENIGKPEISTKDKVLLYFMEKITSTTAQLANDLGISVPTTQKLINELIDENTILNNGKISTGEGRPPIQYGLNPTAYYFIGIHIQKTGVDIGLMNFIGEMVHTKTYKEYQYKNTKESLSELCNYISRFISEVSIPKKSIKQIGLNASGRVNTELGVGYNMFTFLETSLSKEVEKQVGYPVCIENDTRAMLYAEMAQGEAKDKKDVVYIYASWGLGSALISNGEVVEGKSGFAGEIGHWAVFKNEQLCHCGKKGCLETEASGTAFHRRLLEEVRNGKQSILSEKMLSEPEKVTLKDLIDATNQEDLLCIEIMEEIGIKLGKQISCLINLLNPELILIGGELAQTEGYLLRPIITAVSKYTLNLVSNDAIIKTSTLGEYTEVLGACLFARNKFCQLPIQS